jgi:hypothetical protein
MPKIIKDRKKKQKDTFLNTFSNSFSSTFSNTFSNSWKTFSFGPKDEDQRLTLFELEYMKNWFSTKNIDSYLFTLDCLQGKNYQALEYGPYILLVKNGLDLLMSELLLSVKQKNNYTMPIEFIAHLGLPTKIIYKRIDQINNKKAQIFFIKVENGDLLIHSNSCFENYISINKNSSLSWSN